MTVFISHSFQNKPEFDNVVDALDQKAVPYWNPAEVKSGASLREQLRSAVERCNTCIFIATRDSIDSSWCGAELGAFWGAGKPIIVYLAEASLQEAELPPVVQGDVFERRIAKIAERAKEIIATATTFPQDATAQASRVVGQLSVEQFEKLIVSAFSLAAASKKDEKGAASFQLVESAAKQAAGSVLSGFRAASYVGGESSTDSHNKVLWVDDHPENNLYERQAMESMGLEFTLALSTDEALQIFASQRFAAVISDMGRKEGLQEGYVLLEAIRRFDSKTPYFIYASSKAPHHQREAASRGAQGTTNIPQELVGMVIGALPGAS